MSDRGLVNLIGSALAALICALVFPYDSLARWIRSRR